MHTRKENYDIGEESYMIPSAEKGKTKDVRIIDDTLFHSHVKHISTTNHQGDRTSLN